MAEWLANPGWLPLVLIAASLVVILSGLTRSFGLSVMGAVIGLLGIGWWCLASWATTPAEQIRGKIIELASAAEQGEPALIETTIDNRFESPLGDAKQARRRVRSLLERYYFSKVSVRSIDVAVDGNSADCRFVVKVVGESRGQSVVSVFVMEMEWREQAGQWRIISAEQKNLMGR